MHKDTKALAMEIPSKSILIQHGEMYDYVDSYTMSYIDDNQDITSTMIGKTFFTSAPDWSIALFKLRNRIVSLLGLKTPEKGLDPEELLEEFQCEPGERLGLFQVYDKTEKEVVLGEDDKHLDFRISLLKGEKTIDNKINLTITTTIKFNNMFGKLYFLPVKPFHKLIVPRMLSELERKI